MKKSDFIRCVAEENDVTIKSAHLWVNAIFKTLVRCTLDEPEVNISGFGKFEQIVHKPRRNVMPDGKEVITPSKRVLKFTPSIYLEYAMEDGLNSKEFEQRMEIFRAMNRGEDVPGYKFTKCGHSIVPTDIDDKVEVAEEKE